MKFCIYCGKQNLDEAKFCVNCGGSFEETQLETEGSEENKFKGAEEDTVMDLNKTNNENTTEQDQVHKNVNTEHKSQESKKGILSKIDSVLATVNNFFKTASGAVKLAIVTSVGVFILSSFGFLSDGLSGIFNFLGNTYPKNQIITNVIINDKVGIQELAVAKTTCTIQKNIIEHSWFNYVKKKFICDFHYTMKYGYDLSSLNRNDISVNGFAKTVEVRLPKGMVLSSELTKTNIRHNEGILLDWNKVKAEEMDGLQNEAKNEAVTQVLNDARLNQLAKDNTKQALERVVHTVAADYNVIVVGG
ncbi:MAG: DUF4230 domain-containing protein [Phascolarctobacterium sp.]|nr:DUF4230 domain-containing protein [Phascolarctobacterium sp.]